MYRSDSDEKRDLPPEFLVAEPKLLESFLLLGKSLGNALDCRQQDTVDVGHGQVLRIVSDAKRDLLAIGAITSDAQSS